MQNFKDNLQIKLESIMELIKNNPSDINKYIAFFEQEVRDELTRFNLLESKSFVEDFMHKRAITEIMDNFRKFTATITTKASSWIEMVEEKNTIQLERAISKELVF